MSGKAQTAALEALVEAHTQELHLPTVRRRFRPLADEAARAQQTPSPTSPPCSKQRYKSEPSAESAGASSTPASPC